MINKCAHGNYIPKGDTVAPNCFGCETAKLGIFAGQRRRIDVIMPDRVLDASEYNVASVSARLNDAFTMSDMSL